MIYTLKGAPEILLLLYDHVWEGVWKQKQGEGRHGWEGGMRIFPGIIFSLAVFLGFYQLSRAGLFTEFFKKSNDPSTPLLTHTHTPPLHPWHVGPAVERVIVTPCPMLGRTHRPNCPCQRPDSGCEILDLTSSPFMKEHRGTGLEEKGGRGGGGGEDGTSWVGGDGGVGAVKLHASCICGSHQIPLVDI